MVGDGFRHQIDGVSVVKQVRPRAHLLHILDDALHGVDRAQRHEKAARSLRLLPDDAVLERYALVEVPRLKTARPEAGQHGVAVAQAGTPVGGGGDCQVKAGIAGHLLAQDAYDIQTLRAQIDQNDLRALEVLPLIDEGSDGARRPRAATTDIGDLESCHVPAPAGDAAATMRRRILLQRPSYRITIA